MFFDVKKAFLHISDKFDFIFKMLWIWQDDCFESFTILDSLRWKCVGDVHWLVSHVWHASTSVADQNCVLIISLLVVRKLVFVGVSLYIRGPLRAHLNTNYTRRGRHSLCVCYVQRKLGNNWKKTRISGVSVSRETQMWNYDGSRRSPWKIRSTGEMISLGF